MRCCGGTAVDTTARAACACWPVVRSDRDGDRGSDSDRDSGSDSLPRRVLFSQNTAVRQTKLYNEEKEEESQDVCVCVRLFLITGQKRGMQRGATGLPPGWLALPVCWHACHTPPGQRSLPTGSTRPGGASAINLHQIALICHFHAVKVDVRPRPFFSHCTKHFERLVDVWILCFYDHSTTF